MLLQQYKRDIMMNNEQHLCGIVTMNTEVANGHSGACAHADKVVHATRWYV